MRDTRGNYINTKAITDNGPDWAKGCEKCTFGLINPPKRSRLLILAEQRAVEAEHELLQFCTCRAAHMYRQYLRKVYANILMADRIIMYDIVMMERVPTMHYEGAIATARVHAVKDKPA